MTDPAILTPEAPAPLDAAEAEELAAFRRARDSLNQWVPGKGGITVHTLQHESLHVTELVDGTCVLSRHEGGKGCTWRAELSKQARAALAALLAPKA